ncbi:MAG: GDP-mannose 4,6-dehydratase [Oligoflexia bacterium]|nr:GDP-mannose 4,6-dehydratase [Oligoflexia bacterium]
MGEKYLVIGGNGIFGVHMIKYLLETNPKAQVISVGRNEEKIKAFSLYKGIDDSRFAYHKIHAVFETEKLFELFEKEKPDYIINFAALAASVAASWDYATDYYETNTVWLAKAADHLVGKKWLKKWVQIGSSEIFGAVKGPASESTPYNPSTPYAVSKLAGDLHLKAVCKVRGFPMNILWPSNGYGSGQQLYRIVPRTVLACLLGRELPLQGGGAAVKSYIHARDLAHGIFLTLKNADIGKCYTMGPKDGGISIKDLVFKTITLMDRNPNDIVKIAPDRLGQDAQYLLDSTRIHAELGWTPEISIEEGLLETINWAKTYLNDLKSLPTEVVFEP